MWEILKLVLLGIFGTSLSASGTLGCFTWPTFLWCHPETMVFAFIFHCLTCVFVDRKISLFLPQFSRRFIWLYLVYIFDMKNMRFYEQNRNLWLFSGFDDRSANFMTFYDQWEAWRPMRILVQIQHKLKTLKLDHQLQVQLSSLMWDYNHNTLPAWIIKIAF